jgi:hypothetical protein
VWNQPKGKALERGSDECQYNDNAAMSAMFAMTKTYASLESSFGCLASSLGQALDDRRQVQRDHSSEMERLQQSWLRWLCRGIRRWLRLAGCRDRWDT